MRTMKKFLAAAVLSASLSAVMAGTALAKFNYNVGNKYVGSAEAEFTEYESPHMERVMVVQDGTDVILTPKEDNTYFYFVAYDTNGNMIWEDPICDMVPAGTPVTFIMKKHLTREDVPNLANRGLDSLEAGAYRIVQFNMDTEWYYWNYFVVDGAFDTEKLKNLELKWDKTYAWTQNDGKWQVTSPDGISLCDEWYCDPASGNYYYLDRNGNMLTDAVTPDGYYVNADGVWVQ
ncbi:MAG: hypothetical protein HFG78_00565 [Hungatella sp.]|jgi:hypothetical protein|nr:hypothetical protein [Hungatella sp.]MCI9502323.1 hypothetical protein [Hungatella sp.]MCI9637394.1 hypothetical protein [Hungatella sp.]